MAKEKLEDEIEYKEYAEYLEDKTEKDKSGQVKFKSVNHSERALANGVATDGEISTYANYALEYFGHRCALSGERLVVFDIPVKRGENQKIATNLSAEHIVALTTGGNDIIPNVVPSVLQYNIQKNGYYILDWWSKARNIEGKPIYNEERLLKLVNYMLKSLQIRKELGIKERPREYKKRLLTPNAIDKYLAQEEVAKRLISDVITATEEDIDGKKILTKIPEQEGAIPSLTEQKENEIKITEEIFLTDSIELLEKGKNIPQEIIKNLKGLYKDVKGEIPFEIEVRSKILRTLEEMGIEENKYTVANTLLLNTKLLDQARENVEGIQKIIKDYLEKQVKRLNGALTEDQIKIAISNMPNVLFEETARNRIVFWKENRKDSLEELLIEHTATDEFIDVLIVLKKNEISLADIQQGKKIIDLIKDKENKEEILEQLQNISEEINEEWPIGKRLGTQKSSNLTQLQAELEKAGLDLTDEEKKVILETESKKEKSQRKTKEFVQVLKILKENEISLGDIQQGKKIIDLIKDKENKEEILKQLKNISEEINEKWPIGGRLSHQKRNLTQLQTEVEKAGLDLTGEEKKVILETESKKEKSQRKTEEFVQVLKILKENEISLGDIQQGKKIIDLIKDKENKEEILEQLQNISEEINEEWPIGKRLGTQKSSNLTQLEAELEKAGIDLTDEEKKVILETESKKEKSQRKTKEFVQVLKILKENEISLGDIQQGKKIIDLIKDKENKEEILKQLKNISEEINEKWPIGGRLSHQKRNLTQLQTEVEKAGLDLTDEEKKVILETESKKEESQRKTKEFVQVLKILKENEISLADIQQRKKIIDLIKNKENKEGILEQLQNISEEINEEWPIGGRLRTQKSSNLTQLQAELEKAGIDLTDEEKKVILETESNKEESQRKTKEFVQVLKILKENEISLADIQKGKKIIDLIKDKENKEEILEQLKNISEEINEKWPIGGRLRNQKTNNLTQLEAELEKAGIDLTDEEKKVILETESKKEESQRKTKEFVQVLKILKENEISLADIQQRKKIIDLIKDKENKEEILERLQNISEEINEKWPIGVRLNNQKANNLTQLEAELKKAGLDLTDEEKKKILVKINSKGKIKDTVKQNKGNLYETIKAGEELEAEILMVEKTSERSASDVRGQ